MNTLIPPSSETRHIGKSKRLLNLGCGATFHPEWLNIDFHDHGGAVLAYDLRLGIPFADDTFDVVYHSHVLEHFTYNQGRRFLRECFRVLRPGGLLRLAVPDLENISRAYIASLDAVRAGEPGSADRHEWMIIELIDQMTRVESGGAMADYWRRSPLPQEEFLISRSGMELINFRNCPATGKKPGKEQIAPLSQPDVGFLQSGELHRWMYDEISLRFFLEQTGFSDITRQRFDSSIDQSLLTYKLDSAPDGTVRKPDSLFMEATKQQGVQPKPAGRIALLAMTEAGGAGIAAFRQHLSLLEVGVLSNMYVADQRVLASNLHIMPISGQRICPSPVRGAAQLSGLDDSRNKGLIAISKYPLRPRGQEFFSTLASCATLSAMPFQDDFAVINLHWVADFFSVPDNLDTLLERPVVWTLHDMRPFTGGCHYAGECRRFEKNCGECPQLGSSDPKDLSLATWSAQMAAYRELDLHIVAPSEWLAEQARQSSLFRRFPIHVIRYAQPLDIFRPLRKGPLRAAMGIGADELVLTFSAQDLTNSRKGMEYLLSALKLLAERSWSDKIRLLLLGNHPPESFFSLGLRADAVGHVDEPAQMAMLYSVADAVLVPSLEDNSPNVICEAAGCGIPTVAFASGGIPEMILHQRTGWLAPTRDSGALAQGIEWAFENRQDPKIPLQCRALALELWNPAERAREYGKLFAELAASRGRSL